MSNIKHSKTRESKAVAIEYKRHELARNLKFDELMTSYKSSFEIKNKNTSSFWNLLNNQTSIVEKNKSPFEYNRLNSVIKMLPKKDIKILNIGFGKGSLERLVADGYKKYSWYGIDISPTAVRQMIKRYPDWTFSVSNIIQLPFNSNFFNVVVAMEVMEHVSPSKTLSAFSEIKRVLKKGGLFISSIPVNEGLEKMLKVNRNLSAHVRIYTKELYFAELYTSGFRTQEIKELFAFGDNYFVKSILAKLFKIRQPNNLIFKAVIEN